MKFFTIIPIILKAIVSMFKAKHAPESYDVTETLNNVHKEQPAEILEAEKTLIEAKSKLKEKRKAPKKIKVPKDPE